MLFGFQESHLIRDFALWLIGVPAGLFLIAFSVKAVIDPEFCRSERHIEKMRHFEKLEQMGTKQRPLEAREIESETVEASIPKKQLDQNTSEAL